MGGIPERLRSKIKDNALQDCYWKEYKNVRVDRKKHLTSCSQRRSKRRRRRRTMSDYETEATQIPTTVSIEVIEEEKPKNVGKAPKSKKDKPAPYSTKGKEPKKPKKPKKVAPTTEVDALPASNAEDAGPSGLGGAYVYNNIEELLEGLENVHSYTCPIHKDQLMEVVHSQKEHIKDTFLRCNVKGCPAFCSTDKYEFYYSKVNEQGHSWFTIDRIAQMKCECGYDPTLAVSGPTAKNPNRCYLRCRDNLCENFFSWWDQKPYRPVQKIMLQKYDD